MSGEAQQLSFMQGEISPEFYYRSDLASFNSSVSRAVNVKLGPLGGLSNRKGSKVEATEASKRGIITNLQSSNDYVSCVFQHFITKKILKLEVFNNQGQITIHCVGTELNKFVNNMASIEKEYDIAGDLLSGLKGLHFVIHNDLLIFSKTLPVRYLTADLMDVYGDYTNYTLPLDGTHRYSETQFCIRMVPPVSGSNRSAAGIRLEANHTLQNAVNLAVPFTYGVQNSSTAGSTITGNASYAVVAETAEGIDASLYVINSITGVNLTVTSPTGTINDIIPYPINGTSTNLLNVNSVSNNLQGFGGRTITKLKVYRTTGKHVAYGSLYKLVAKFGVDGATSISINDAGQEEAAYTACSDTSALYKQPSFHQVCGNYWVNTLTGGLKTVVDTTIFQQRAYYAISKGPWWGTSVYNNTIVASRIGAINQVIFPQISNPNEAFQFNVPEERGGFLTHVASMSRLVAFTNTSTFIIQGDQAGIITPTSINPFKVLSFGCMEGVPPVVSGDTCLFASTGGGVGYLTLASDGGAVGGNASALAGHLFENKTILSIVPIEDRKSLPRFLINTTAGDVYECYKVGEVFAFFRVEMLGLPTGGNIGKGATFPMTMVHSPSFAKYSLGAEAYVNFRATDSVTFNSYVNAIAITPEPLVRSKYFDFESQLDFATDTGSYSRFLTDPGTADNYATSLEYPIFPGWRYESMYSICSRVSPYTVGFSKIEYLVDPLGTWLAGNPIYLTGVDTLPVSFLENTCTILGAKYMRFCWLDDARNLKTAFATLIEGADIGGVSSKKECNFEFIEDVPLALQEKTVYFNPPGNTDIDNLLVSGYVLAELAFDQVLFGYDSTVPGFGVPAYPGYSNLKGFCDMMLPYDITNNGTFDAPIEIPITLEVNGNVYGNFKDPLEFSPILIKHYYDTRTHPITGDVYGPNNFFEITLPEPCTWFSMGAPAIGEIETLPVASIQQDITDAKKNINYTTILLYNTKGLRVGETGQPDTELERFDFTTDDSVTEAVYFSGPKSYNHASTWNDHGRIRVSGMDLQPFSISGIIPKGNVGSF